MEISNPTEWLVPNILDRLAATTPNAPYAEYPNSPLTYDDGYRCITYAELANAVNCCASFLLDKLGPGKHSVLPYIGPNDLRYIALILGATKAGYTLFNTSPRNSVAAQSKLLERLKCQHILSPCPHPPQIDAMAQATGLPIVEVPSVAEMLDRKHPHVPFKQFEESVLDEPFFAIHTSGSTGLPKPLIWTHRTALRNITMLDAKPVDGVPTLNSHLVKKRIWFSFPPFHGAYLLIHLCIAIPFGVVPIAPISGAPPSAAGVVAGLKQCPADIAVLVPSIASDLTESPELLDYCAENLNMIWYCGGDLPPAVGDIITSKIRLANLYGASEMGIIAQVWSPDLFDLSDWKYLQYHPSAGYEMREAEDGTHEFTIVRNEKKITSQCCFTIFTEASEYASRDLFVPHPTKQHFWKWVARRDDIVVFLNGEKTNPISMEQHIMQDNPKVKYALVAGAQRFQAALMIEPASDQELTTSQRAAFIEDLWPTIEEANRECPAHARISKSHIMFTKPSKPMARTAKGTVQRFSTYTLYAEEIESLYRDAESIDSREGQSKDGARLATFQEEGSAESFMRDTVANITGWKDLDDEGNFFTLGMDSLQAITLARKLRQAFGLSSISLSAIYTNPSVDLLSKAIFKISSTHRGLGQGEQEQTLETRNKLRLKYLAEIETMRPSHKNVPRSDNAETVLLTGSTGALGCHLLQVLSENPNVSHVYCLNRGADSGARQKQRSFALGLQSSFPSENVTFLTTNLTEPKFGLTAETYDTLLQRATTIIHNAWPVNFNLPLTAFEPQLQGIVNLVGFAASATLSPHLFFLSSISSVLSEPFKSIPERVVESDTAPANNGYAESKYLSELLLSHAASHHPKIHASFARVGQIAGSIAYKGMWNRAEWFPSLVLSSLCVGAIPNNLGPSLGRVDWVPADRLAVVLTEMAFGKSASVTENVGVYHPLNSHPVSWPSVRDVIVDVLAARTGKRLESIGLKEWIARVKAHGKKTLGEDVKLEDGELEGYLEGNPALKLLDFYEGILAGADGGKEDGALDGVNGPNGDTEFNGEGDGGRSWVQEKSLEASKELRELEGVRESWVRKWVGEWIESKREC